jgi:hypothetical protein
MVRADSAPSTPRRRLQELIGTQAPTPKPPPLPGIAWPMWGFDTVHNRTSPYPHRPPFRIAWSFGARQLVEFPPAVAYAARIFAMTERR